MLVCVQMYVCLYWLVGRVGGSMFDYKFVCGNIVCAVIGCFRAIFDARYAFVNILCAVIGCF